MSPFYDLPTCGIKFPSSPSLEAALEYTKEHTSPATVNHCLRAAAFALVCIRKVPELAGTNEEVVVMSIIFHDMGWATTRSLRSPDRRFEVDGAELARAWYREHSAQLGWDEARMQLSWDAIALHATASIAKYKEREVVATNMGIASDFLGSNLPGGLVSAEEQREIARAFPRVGFHDEVIEILCGLCKDKPETTYDNFVGHFGLKFGLDGKGGGREEFTRQFNDSLYSEVMINGLEKSIEIEDK